MEARPSPLNLMDRSGREAITTERLEQARREPLVGRQCGVNILAIGNFTN